MLVVIYAMVCVLIGWLAHGEMVLREAVVCKHCGRDLPPLTAEELAVPPPPEPSWLQKELSADRDLLNSFKRKKPDANERNS
jgi:hypothetical protein